MAAEAFRGFTVEEYRAYVRKVMAESAAGFENMTYGEGFYLPMVSLVRYLSEHGFTVFISSGSERSLARELIADTLGEWIPPDRVIGSTFSLEASGQGETDGRKYTYASDDRVLLEGNLLQKNQKMNKVVSIVNEIGAAPLLVFGNSSGDVSMAQYAVQHGGRAYMLLCRFLGYPCVIAVIVKLGIGLIGKLPCERIFIQHINVPVFRSVHISYVVK